MKHASTAVMARRLSPPKALDYFPTPPWCTRALLTHVLPVRRNCHVWEPACGEMHMAHVLAEYADTVTASDVWDYGVGVAVYDFLGAGDLVSGVAPCVDPDWIITNPPFSYAQQFVERALELATSGVAILVRTGFLESAGRYRLFTEHPPYRIAQFAGRVNFAKGKLDPDADPATAMCWIVWHRRPADYTEFVWIDPSARKWLERPGDYPQENVFDGE